MATISSLAISLFDARITVMARNFDFEGRTHRAIIANARPAKLVPDESDPIHFPCLLSLGGERRRREADSETDREPDPPHGHLVGMAGAKSSRT